MLLCFERRGEVLEKPLMPAKIYARDSLIELWFNVAHTHTRLTALFPGLPG